MTTSISSEAHEIMDGNKDEEPTKSRFPHFVSYGRTDILNYKVVLVLIWERFLDEKLHYNPYMLVGLSAFKWLLMQ